MFRVRTAVGVVVPVELDVSEGGLVFEDELAVFAVGEEEVITKLRIG